MITTEAGIYHDWLKDIYIILGNEQDGIWSIKVYLNPLVSFIWIGVFIMIFSGFIAIFKKMKKIIKFVPLIFINFSLCFFLLFIIFEKDPSNPPSALINKQIPHFSTLNLYDENIKLSSRQYLKVHRNLYTYKFFCFLVYTM